jgi:EmrB/QacA subfamily drug resistance transporter
VSVTSTDAATPPDLSGAPAARKGLILLVIVAAQLLIVLDATIVNIALPTAQKALNISDADRQWMITAYTLAFGGLLLLGGRIADFTGRKRAFIIGLLGFAAASALGGLAQNEFMLFGARALQGAFGALMAPAALSLLTVTFTEAKERARAFGVYGAIAGGGGAVGLLLGGVLTEYASWRWTLLISTPIAIIAALGATKYISESKAEGSTRYDLPGAFTSTLGLVALVYGFTKAASDGWDSTTTIVTLVVAAALLVSFVFIELRSSHPLLPMRVILNGNRGGAFLSALLLGVAIFGVFLFLTLYLQQSLGYSALKSGVAFLPFTIGIVAGATISAQLQTKIGPRILMVTGLVLGAVGMVLLTGISLDTSYWTHVLPACVVLSFGIGLVFGPMSSTALIGIANHDAGVASALINTTQQIGGSLGTALLNTIVTSAIAGYLVDHRGSLPAVATIHGYTTAFWVSAVVIIVAAVAAAVLVKAKRDEVAAVGGGHVAM